MGTPVDGGDELENAPRAQEHLGRLEQDQTIGVDDVLAELAQIAQVVAVEEHVAAEHTLELTLEKACLHRARELVVR